MNRVISFAGLVLSILLPTKAVAQPAHFESIREYLTAAPSNEALVADFTGTGRIDVLAPGARFRSDGTGALVAVSSEGAGFARDARCFADFDGDGRPEAVGSLSSYDSVGLIEINSDDEVRYRVFVSSLGTWTAFAAADFDGDGDVDVAAGADLPASEGPENLLIGVNFGDGRIDFFPRTFPRRIGTRIDRLAAGDLNGDGTPDLAGSDPVENRTWILAGAGDLTFGVAGPIGPASTTFLRTTDIDGDGIADLVSCELGPSAIETRLGTPSGSFAAPIVIATPTRPDVIETADLNGDGLVDVAFTDYGPKARLRTAFFTPAGGFSSFAETPAAVRSGSLDLVDLDDDGILDAITGRTFEKSLRVQRGRADGRFEDVPRVEVDELTRGILVGRFDAGPTIDVAYYRPTFRSGFVGVLPGNGCTVEPRTAPETQIIIGNIIARGDFDKDGLDDIAASSPEGPIVFFGDPSGTFSRVVRLPAPGGHLTITDVDADGNEDLVATMITGIGTFFGDGSGAFGPPVLSGDLDLRYNSVASDFNGDGLPDLAVRLLERTAICMGDGTGAFIETASFPIEQGTDQLAAGDLNRDGLADLVLSSSYRTRVFLQEGGGVFAPPVALPGVAMSGCPRIADFDADGFQDILVAGVSATLYLGDSLGGFEAGQSFAHGAACEWSEVVDMNGDGHLDWVGLDSYEMDVVILYSVGPLVRARRGNVNEGIGPRADVVFVNGSPGADCRRRVDLAMTEAMDVSVAATPAGGRRFALYAWPRRATAETVRTLPQGTGLTVLPIPATPDPIQPRVIWNNWGFAASLGTATHPSSIAPSRVLFLPQGLGRAATFTLQGLIQDPGAANGRAAVTNAVEVTVR